MSTMKLKSLLIALCLMAMAALTSTTRAAGTNIVSVNGFTFSYPSDLAGQMNVSQFAGESPEQDGPGSPEPPHTLIVLYDSQENPPKVPATYEAPVVINVYKVADLAKYNFSQKQFADLDKLLKAKTDPAALMAIKPTTPEASLPFLPVYPAAQVIRGRVQYAQSPSFNGVKFVTVFRQDVSPFTGSEFIYTYQGLSTDKSLYVSAIFRLSTKLFPDTIPNNFNYDAFSKNFEQYLTESIDKLNKAQPASFAPNLTILDGIMSSFALK